MSVPDLTILLAKAREYAGPSTMAPGVFDAEAHVAAWHAITIQGGFTSPEREAWRLAADYRAVSKLESEANERAVTNETPVNMELVAEIVGPVGVLMPPPTAQPQANDRGEYADAGGNLWHQVSVPQAPDFALHEGAWLDCHGCNPPVVLRAQPGTDAEALRREYDDAKAQSAAAEERFKTAKSKLQQYLAEATDGALRAELYVDGYKPMTLVYTEPWRLDSKRLKAEQPALYVEYAKRGQVWTLAESRAKS